MVTFKVLQLCNEGIFLLNGAVAGFPFKGWYWLVCEREEEMEEERIRGWEGWL